MFKSISSKVQRDKDFPQRQFDIDVLTRVIKGKLYDCLQHDFNQEREDGTGKYIPLRERRPSVRYALCKIVVDDSVSLLFSEGHFPSVNCADEKTRDSLSSLIEETNLNEVMIEAATTGSVGSAAILMRVLSKRVFFSVFNTMYLTPVWKKDAPDTLEKVIEKYKVKGEVLKAQGYDGIDSDSSDYWFQREWDEVAETWYQPWKVVGAEKDFTPKIDDKNTTTHSLGFVPIVWVKNLPGGDDIDGACTFPTEVIDTQIEIDYQLSQGGRGLKYSSDPLMMIKNPAGADTGSMVKGAGNALVVSEDGDAKLLEINGTACEAVINYVRCLREMALESAHGNRTSADKIAAAQSGRAMELMNLALVNLADRLRISYGQGALLNLLRMIVKASAKVEITTDGQAIGELSQKDKVTLRWPQWYAPTYADKLTESQTLVDLRTAGLLSFDTSVKTLASNYDIADPQEEMKLIEAKPFVPPAAPVSEPKEPLSNSED